MSDDALHFAEQGLSLPHDHAHEYLIDRVATAATEAGDHHRARDLRRTYFEARPTRSSLDEWRATLDDDAWAAERPGAEALLRKENPGDYYHLMKTADRIDEAWQVANENSILSDWEWQNLLPLRAKTHPKDVVPICRTMIHDVLRETGQSRYESATRLLLVMRDAMEATGQAEGFATYMDELAETNRRRRNCIALWREHGLVN